jgi:hypothetical protein
VRPGSAIESSAGPDTCTRLSADAASGVAPPDTPAGRREQHYEACDENQDAAFEHARNMRKHDVAPLALTRWRLYDCGLLMLGT